MRKNSYMTATDQFCGAGGFTISAAAAGIDVKTALNHWKVAIESHNANFPDTFHDCTDISACDPRRYRSTDILMSSPECTNHSQAKGQKRSLYADDLWKSTLPNPAEERSRATMWDVPRFAEFHNYNLVIVENVVEARLWRLWDAWLKAMHDLGYEHQIVYFNSQFALPTPQSRDRMYIIFHKRGNKAPDLRFTPAGYCHQCEKNVAAIQSWKNPTKRWGRYGKTRQYVYRCPLCAQEMVPYYLCAANAIDWSLPAERIGNRARPLKDKTIRRIELGLQKYRNQFLVQLNKSDEERMRVMYQPMPTQTGDNGLAVVDPFVVELAHSNADDARSFSAQQPWSTQTTRQDKGLVVPFLVEMVHGMNSAGNIRSTSVESAWPTQTTRGEKALVIPPYIVDLLWEYRPKGLHEPLSTVVAGGNHHGVVLPPGADASFLLEIYGTGITRSVAEPLATVTAQGNHHALATIPHEATSAFLTSYYGQDSIRSVQDALGTVTTVDRHAIAIPGEPPRVEDCGFRMLRPHEIGKAMAFPSSYIVKGTQRDQVRQYGNALTPPVMQMILERCIESLT